MRSCSLSTEDSDNLSFFENEKHPKYFLANRRLLC